MTESKDYMNSASYEFKNMSARGGHECRLSAGNLSYINYIKLIYTETKKFSNTSQIRILISEIHVEINTN